MLMIRRLILAILLITLLLCVSAQAGEVIVANKSAEAKQMWNLQDADIRAVTQTISQLTGKNFIIDPRVQGKITIISSHPMSTDELYQVFLSMLQVLNYVAIPAGQVIKIIPAVQAKEYGGHLSSSSHPGVGDEVVVQVVPINNISATQLVPVLRPLIQEWGTVSAYNPSNTLILAGSAANVQRLMSIIHNMDEKNANTIQVIPLKYASAKKSVEALNALQTSVRNEGSVSNVSFAADEENNTILVSGNMANRLQIRRLISKLDIRNANTNVTTVVVPLNYLNAKKLAPILTKIARGKIAQQNTHHDNNTPANFGIGEPTNNSNSSTNISIQAEEDDNAIVINAPSTMVNMLRRIIKQLDIRPEQVLIQAIIVRVNESVLNQLGVQWGTTNGNNAVSVDTFPAGIGFIPHGNLQVLIQALMTNSSTDVLATPSIVVLNNKSAVIDDGQNIGIINREYEGTGAAITNQSTLPFNTFERKDVTLQLKVKPRIAPDDSVQLLISQQNNSIDPDAKSTPNNPVINTSKIQTSVLVTDGDILVLGGLISSDNKQISNKVPILGDIPILGYLFRYKNQTAEKKNLMVFIRPVILHNRKQRYRETLHDYDYVRFQQFREKAGFGLNPNERPILPSIHPIKPVALPPPFATEYHE